MRFLGSNDDPAGAQRMRALLGSTQRSPGFRAMSFDPALALPLDLWDLIAARCRRSDDAVVTRSAGSSFARCTTLHFCSIRGFGATGQKPRVDRSAPFPFSLRKLSAVNNIRCGAAPTTGHGATILAVVKQSEQVALRSPRCLTVAVILLGMLLSAAAPLPVPSPLHRRATRFRRLLASRLPGPRRASCACSAMTLCRRRHAAGGC